MERALALARRGLFSAHPNPRVGCVLVGSDGEIVGEGWHRQTGEAHAEVDALRQAGERARGATAYVTLEPCCHQGRTPPCTDALIETGVACVIAATEDPNPRVAGEGFARLREAGIDASLIDSSPLTREAIELNAGFFRRATTGRPFVRLKLAMSLDGRTALPNGESRWITGTGARRDVQRWRARAGAIITGSGTVLADDPRLTLRPDELELRDTGSGEEASPDPDRLLRVVLDSRLTTPATAKLFESPAPVLIATTAMRGEQAARLTSAGAEVIALEEADDPGLPAAPENTASSHAVPIDPLLRLLAEREINEVHVECGPTLAGAFVAGGWVDEFLLYCAPTLLGDNSRPLLHLPAPPDMTARPELDIVEVERLREDIRIRATPRAAPPSEATLC